MGGHRGRSYMHLNTMTTKNTILDSLNDSQREAVTFARGPLLILAGAGSGKTRVLTHRIAYLIANGVQPYEFLAVTFTNKAAGEMRERIARLVKAHVWVNTFHSSCLRILKREARHAGLREEFSIYDDSDQLILIKECLRQLRLDEKQYVPKTIREKISRAKDEVLTPADYRLRAETYYEEILADIYALYEEKLNTYNAIDFGGLICRSIELFENNPDILRSYQERFQYILIDEYQDTNHAQYRWVNLLAREHHNITVVGDPDQSIYGWRGADISNILSFEDDYPNATLVMLDKNYRSTSTILDASNALISCNSSRKEKKLWTDQEEGEPLYVYEATTERDEAEFLIRTIDEFRRQGQDINDMVVFYRVHAQSRVIEESLRRYNIPYRIVGGVRFYDRKEIKDLLAYLRVIAYPDDEVSLRRIINTPTRGIGKKALEVLSAYKNKEGISLYTALGAARAITRLGAKAQKSICAFYETLESLRLRKDHMLPSDVVREIVEAVDYMSELEKAGSLEARSRMENIKEFIGAITEFESHAQADQETNLISAFLDMISLQTAVDTMDNEEGMLTLMTMHCAKGLEFDTVFIIGMEEDLFPHANVLDSDARDLEEERRLCYVAITRARKRVYLSYAQVRRLYGVRMHNMPSRFLREIPSEYMEFIERPYSRAVRSFSSDLDEVIDYDFEW